ncbi:MAG: ECF transporter S component [Candidatus Syntrophosphaera sp.]|nr:ECF transporter S component [Candidatus Syntrophosphaera sp.]
MFKRFTTQDLIVIAALAGIGIAIKPIVSPLSKMISTPLMVPGGSFTGGLYMLWLVLAVLIVSKRGTGTIYGLLQALIIMVAGMRGNQGLLSIVSYTLPGIAVDLVYPVLRHPERLCTHLILCALANMTGALVVAVLLFRHPLPLVAIILGMSLLSGLLGGLVSHGIYKTLKHYELIT